MQEPAVGFVRAHKKGTLNPRAYRLKLELCSRRNGRTFQLPGKLAAWADQRGTATLRAPQVRLDANPNILHPDHRWSLARMRWAIASWKYMAACGN